MFRYFGYEVNVDSVPCVMCVFVWRMSQMYPKDFICSKCEGNIEEAMEQEEKFFNEVYPSW